MGHRSRSSRVLQGRLLLNREHELSQLCHALDGALRGRGQIVLTAGEAGIGKTTLAQVFAARANTRGARVLWGRSGDLEGSPPYWPWAEALRALAEDGSTDVQASFAPGARYLSLVLPELRERFPFDRSSVPDDESVRFHVADAVRAVLQRAARQRSILLVLEDLHWADQGSLFLLEFMAQEIGANFVAGPCNLSRRRSCSSAGTNAGRARTTGRAAHHVERSHAGRHGAFAGQTDRSTPCDTRRPTDPRANRRQPVFCDRDGQGRHPRSARHSRQRADGDLEAPQPSVGAREPRRWSSPPWSGASSIFRCSARRCPTQAKKPFSTPSTKRCRRS